jgi:hypothetical protein
MVYLRHLPLTLDGCHIEASAGKVYLCHVEGYDLGPAEQEAIAAEIVRRVNLHDELVEALRDIAEQCRGPASSAQDSLDWIRVECSAILAKVDPEAR